MFSCLHHCCLQVIRAILSLENAPSTDAAVRERIASLPREVSDATLLQKVNDQHTLDALRKDVSSRQLNGESISMCFIRLNAD